MMKRTHFFRNFALLGVGLVGLLMAIPSPQGLTESASPSGRSILATSPKLSEYLDARLRAHLPQNAEMAKPKLADDTPGLNPAVGHIVLTSAKTASSANEMIVRTTPGNDGAQLDASKESAFEVAVVPAVATALDVEEFANRSSASLNVRAGPSTDNAKLFVLKAGTPVRIDQALGDWAKITTADGATGWAYGPYLEAANADASPPSLDSTASAAVEKRQVRNDNAKPAIAVGGSDAPRTSHGKTFRLENTTTLRSSPARSARQITVITGGTKLLVAEWDRNWARVVLADGTSGWINVR
jgi:SH3-like domain-containing protein